MAYRRLIYNPAPSFRFTEPTSARVRVPVYWNGDFPTNLAGTSVTINNQLAYLAYLSSMQINLQALNDTTRGPSNLTVTTSAGSARTTVSLVDLNPAFLIQGDGKHVGGIILRTDGSGAYGNGSYDIIGLGGIRSAM